MSVGGRCSFLKSKVQRRCRKLAITFAAVLLFGSKVSIAEKPVLGGDEVESVDVDIIATARGIATSIPSGEPHEGDSCGPNLPGDTCSVGISSGGSEQEGNSVVDTVALGEIPSDMASMEGAKLKSNHGSYECAATVDEDSSLAACHASLGRLEVAQDSTPEIDGEDGGIGKYESADGPDDSVTQSKHEVMASDEIDDYTVMREVGNESEPDDVPWAVHENENINEADFAGVNTTSSNYQGEQHSSAEVARTLDADQDSSVAPAEHGPEMTSHTPSDELPDIAPDVVKVNDESMSQSFSSASHSGHESTSSGLDVTLTAPVLAGNSLTTEIPHETEKGQANSVGNLPAVVATATPRSGIDGDISSQASPSPSTVDSTGLGALLPGDNHQNRGEGWAVVSERDTKDIDAHRSGKATIGEGFAGGDEGEHVSPEAYLVTRVHWVETELLKKLREEEDARSLLDIWVERAREFILTRTVPPTDAQCEFSWRRLRCEPKCECGARLRFGDYTPGRACRLLHPWERSPSCESSWDPSDEPALARLLNAAKWTLGTARRVYEARVAPPTDEECSFSFQTGRCEPRGLCRLRWRFGDVTLSSACRLSEKEI